MIGRVCQIYHLLNTFSLHVTMSSSIDDVAKLYADIGKGFSEHSSSQVVLHGDQRFHDYQFPLPTKRFARLRFDPLATGGHVRVARMELFNGLGRKVQSLDLASLQPLQQIKSIDIRDQQLIINVEENANDPQLFVPFDYSLILEDISRSFRSFYTRLIAEYVLILLLSCSFLWIWWRRRDWVLRSLLLTSLLVFGWRCEVLYRSATMPFLRVSLQSSVEDQAQLYYDKGQNFNEADSSKAYIKFGNQYRDYLFPLPRTATIAALRFDPLRGGGTMRIRETSVVNGLGHRLLEIDLSLWVAGHQIRDFNRQKHEAILVTEKDANDPQLTLTLPSPLVLNLSRSYMTDAFLGRVLLESLIIAIITAMIHIALKKYLEFASPQPGASVFWDVLFLLASLILLRVYAQGKWEDTIVFVRALLNG